MPPSIFAGPSLAGLLLAAAALPPGCTAGPEPPERVSLEIGGRRFDLELALTPEARYEGLSGRASIPRDGGMLFVFPEAEEQAFVMRDLRIPLDLILLDPSGRVVATHAMKPEPPDTADADLERYRSGWPAVFAIELRGGTLAQLDIERGDRIELPAERLRRWAQ